MNHPALQLYTIIAPIALGMARLISPLHPKLNTFFSLRKGLFNNLENTVSKLPTSTFRLWVHAASVGEFEQARPIIAALKAEHPKLTLFVSFLSDSGYNARKNFADADAVFYLPTDTRSNAKKLLALLEPDLLLLMRYDFWPNHLIEAKKRGTTLILAAAVLQQDSHYFKPFAKSFYRPLFHLFDHIYTVSEKDALAFRENFGCKQVEKAGDPRFDQVALRSKNTAKVEHLRHFFEHRTVLVAGSVWDRDEALLLPAWQELAEQPVLVLVPHQVDPDNMARLYRELRNREIDFVPVSALNGNFNPEKQILVIDQIGYLVELYSIASMAYVGGGFGVNVHNTLEPAVYGIPVIFGPRHHNSPEAEGLLAAGGALLVQSQQELSGAINQLTTNAMKREKIGKSAGSFVQQQSGATAIITESIESYVIRRTREARV